MSALMLTTDLVFSSRVSAVARAHQAGLGIAASTDNLLRLATVAEGLQLVILDLTAADCDPARIVRQLRQSAKPPTVVAYAPHVMESLLQTARDGGCDQVLTRGQFDRKLDSLLSTADN